MSRGRRCASAGRTPLAGTGGGASGLPRNPSRSSSGICTANIWDGELLLFSDPASAPDRKRAAARTATPAGCADAQWLDERKVVTASDTGALNVWDWQGDGTIDLLLELAEHVCSHRRPLGRRSKVLSASEDCSYTAQEEIYRKTLSHFGVNDPAFGNWANGAAWLSWSRGQSMHGVWAGGAGMLPHTSLSRAWMAAQHALQVKILARMREIGIVPILPAFQGNVPPIMKTELFPASNISAQGGGRHYAACDGTDPLFGKIADVYMETMCADFGCNEHWYEADGYFAAGRPPWYQQQERQGRRAE